RAPHRRRQHQARRHRGGARRARREARAVRAGASGGRRGTKRRRRGERRTVSRAPRGAHPARGKSAASGAARRGRMARLWRTRHAARRRGARCAARRGEPPAPSAGLRVGARHRRARERRATVRLCRRRLSRFHAHCLQPSRDVARHLPRQPRPAARRARALPRATRPAREAAAGGRRRGAGARFRRGARRAQPMVEVLELKAARGARGTVRLPGSKSISNRVLLLAALATGETEIRGLLDAEDTRVMREALGRLGVPITERAHALSVHGAAGAFRQKKADLFLGNAGTALRPLTAALALCAGEYLVSGVARMHERPIGGLVEALRAIGARIDYRGQPGFPPLAIHPAKVRVAAPVPVKGDVSSQFLSAMLMALPLSGADATIEVRGELISKPYVEITLNVMRRFGVAVERDGWARFRVPSARYTSPGSIYVEGDASSASYFLAAGAPEDRRRRVDNRQ